MTVKANGRTTVLAIDDDEDLLATLEIQLHLKGYAVQVASSAKTGVEAAVAMAPDIVLLDIGLPDLGGLQVISELRSNFNTACAGIIMVTAQSELAVMREAVSAGADDYLLKPYDVDELCNRIEMVKERTSRNLERNPLTGLPGNNLIRKEVQRRIEECQPFAVGYVDIDNFKAFNDRYGPELGDQMIGVVGTVLVDALKSHGSQNDFAGHIGGDDFIILTKPEQLIQVGKMLFKCFEKETASLYDQEDRERGAMEAKGRDGVRRQFPLCGLSVGAASSVHSKIDSAQRAFELATKAKHFAKSRAGSHLEIWGRNERPSERPSQVPFASNDPIRVLIIEEDRDLAYNLTVGMEQKGYDCKSVDGTDAAVDAFRTFNPDVLLADIALLGAPSGKELLTQIKMNGLALPLPIVALTGERSQTDSSEFVVDSEWELANPEDIEAVDKSVNELLCR